MAKKANGAFADKKNPFQYTDGRLKRNDIESFRRPEHASCFAGIPLPQRQNQPEKKACASNDDISRCTIGGVCFRPRWGKGIKKS
jgi:hypothetical protein